MIQINRTSAAQPQRWATTTAPNALAGLTNAVQQRGGQFDRSAVKSSTFKTARKNLTKLQHDKCCYCEGPIDSSYADVEHVRPMAKYWWLAYDWDNLLVACKYCNETAKRDQFALNPNGIPLKAGERPPGREQARFLDPADPTVPVDDHIVFREHPVTKRWVPVPRNGSDCGRYTIDVLELDLDRNLNRRQEDEANAVWFRTRWRKLLPLVDMAEVRDIRGRVAELCRPNGRYLAMKRAILREILEAEQP